MSYRDGRPTFPPHLESLDSAIPIHYYGGPYSSHWREPMVERRCSYCGTLRLPKKVHCDSCGAPY